LAFCSLAVPEPLVDLLASKSSDPADHQDLLPLPNTLPALEEALQTKALLG
jgi:hypothetical protein